MNVPRLLFGVTASLILLLASTIAQSGPQSAAQNPPAAQQETQQPVPSSQTASQTPGGTATTALPPPSETQGSAPLRVMVGKSLLINTTERLKRVSVTDPNVADALVVTPTQILVHGRAPGEVSLLIWDELERSRSFDLRVDVDVSALVMRINAEVNRVLIANRDDDFKAV